MTTSDNSDTRYMHGADGAEQERLEQMTTVLPGIDFLPALRPGMRILEVGCGTGSLARKVASEVAPDGVVVGVDRQQAQLQTARRLADREGIENLSLHLGDATGLDFPGADFDGAYCRFVVEHVPEPVILVREMMRVVKPGGWVCCFEWENGCSVVYPDSPAVQAVWQAVYDFQLSLEGDPYVARKLYAILNRAGLQQVEAKGRAWSITAADHDKLQVYVGSAREIIRQTREGLLSENRVSPDLLQEADAEYERLLNHPGAFAMEGYVYALGKRREER